VQNDLGMHLSISQLSELTSRDRRRIAKQLKHLQYTARLMLARHIKPKKIVFHSRLLSRETCRMNRVQHLKTKKGFLVFSDSGFMAYQPQT
jgi:hypothetical protein